MTMYHGKAIKTNTTEDRRMGLSFFKRAESLVSKRYTNIMKHGRRMPMGPLVSAAKAKAADDKT